MSHSLPAMISKAGLSQPLSVAWPFRKPRCPRCAPIFTRSKGKDSHEVNGVNGFSHSDPPSWQDTVTGSYLQQGMDDFCLALEEVLRDSSNGDADSDTPSDEAGIWRAIRREAEADAATEPLLSSFLYASILSHDTFERSLAFVLANRLSDATLLSTELFEVFHHVLKSNRHVSEAALADIAAVRERDPSCRAYSQALLYFKGFHSIQVHRIAHELWQSGRKVMALALQSRMSEVFAVDVHPAARIGKGVLLDHGTGVVIGETAVVGDYVSILQNVTLGGTGKEHGDRHPKIADNVLIGASATILGNIQIGQGAQVAAGSLVLKPVPPGTMVAGSPAKEIGTVTGNPAQKMDQWMKEGCEKIQQLQQQQRARRAAPSSSNGAAPPAGNGASGNDGNSPVTRGPDLQRPQLTQQQQQQQAAAPQHAATPRQQPPQQQQQQPPQQQPHSVARPGEHRPQPAAAGTAAAKAGSSGAPSEGATSKGKAADARSKGPKVDPEYFI
ncbi:hypothetical protein N2152v2_001964 [Parachlorella kessleri]